MKLRRATVAVSAPLLFLVGPRPGWLVEVVSNDVPTGAVLVGTAYDWERDQFIVVLEHPSLPETEGGDPLPRLTGPVFREVAAADLAAPDAVVGGVA